MNIKVNETMQDSLLESLRIQKNIIGALLMREIITRYGRKNIGFLWLFIEPLLVVLVITFIRTLLGRSAHGITAAEFALTGYPLFKMWRSASSRCVGAIDSNKGLLYHRNMRILDIYIARVLLEVLGQSLAFLLLMFIFYSVGYVRAPFDVLYMTFAWLLMVWFGFGLGMIVGVVAEIFEVFGRVWGAFGIVLTILSGAFFLVDSLSTRLQQFVLLFPMVHGTEMLRHGYFGNIIKSYESVSFLVIVNILLTFIGLLLIQRYKQGVRVT